MFQNKTSGGLLQNIKTSFSYFHTIVTTHFPSPPPIPIMFLRKLLGSLVVAASLLKYRHSGGITPPNTLEGSATTLQSTEPNCVAVNYAEFDTEKPLSQAPSILTTSLAMLGFTSIAPIPTTSPMFHCSSTLSGITTFDAEKPSHLINPTSSTPKIRYLPRSPWGFAVYTSSASALLGAIIWIVAALGDMRQYPSFILHSLRCLCLYTVQTMWIFVMRKVLHVPAKVPLGDYIHLDQRCSMLAQQLALLQAGKAATDSANSDLTCQLVSLQAKFDRSTQAHIALAAAKDATIGSITSALDQEIKRSNGHFTRALDLILKCHSLEIGSLEKDARISHLSSQLVSTRANVERLDSTVKGLEDAVIERDDVITDLTAQISDVKTQVEVASSHHVTMLAVQEGKVDELKQANSQLQAALSAALERASALSTVLEQTKKDNEAEIAARQENQRRLEEQAVELINDRDNLTKLLEQARTENHSLAKQYKSLLDEDDIMIAGLMCRIQDMENERSEGITDGWDTQGDDINQPNPALVKEHVSPERGSMNWMIPSIVIHPPPIDPPTPPPNIPTSEHTSKDPVSPIQGTFRDGRQTPAISGPAQERSLQERIEEFVECVDPDVTAVDADDLHATPRSTLSAVPPSDAPPASADNTLVNDSDLDAADEDDTSDNVFQPGSPEWEHVRLQLQDIRQEDKAVLDALDGQLESTLEVQKIFTVLVARHRDHLDYISDSDDEGSYKGLESDQVQELYPPDVVNTTAVDNEKEAKPGDINSPPVIDARLNRGDDNGSRAGSSARSGGEDLDTSRVDEDAYASSEDGCTSNRKPSDVGSVSSSSLEGSTQERERAVQRLGQLCVTEDDGLNGLINEPILSFESSESDQLSPIVDDDSDSTPNHENEDDDVSGEAEGEPWLRRSLHDWRETQSWRLLGTIAEEGRGEDESRTPNTNAGILVNDTNPVVSNFEGADQSEGMKEELDTLSPRSKMTTVSRPYKRKPVNHKSSPSSSNTLSGQQQGKHRRTCTACCSSAARA